VDDLIAMGKKVVRAPPRPKSTMKQPSGKRKVEQQDSDDSDGELQMYTDNKVESEEEEVEVFDLGGSDDDEDDDKVSVELIVCLFIGNDEANWSVLLTTGQLVDET
jgi:hypothetical protein